MRKAILETPFEKAKRVNVNPYPRKGKMVIGHLRMDTRTKKEVWNGAEKDFWQQLPGHEHLKRALEIASVGNNKIFVLARTESFGIADPLNEETFRSVLKLVTSLKNPNVVIGNADDLRNRHKDFDMVIEAVNPRESDYTIGESFEEAKRRMDESLKETDMDTKYNIQGNKFLELAEKKLGVDRGKVMKVARSIANLDKSKKIDVIHIAEAIQYQPQDHFWEEIEKAGSSEGVRRGWETRRQKGKYNQRAKEVRDVANSALTWGDDAYDYYKKLRGGGKSHEEAFSQMNSAGEKRARSRIGREPLRPLPEFEKAGKFKIETFSGMGSKEYGSIEEAVKNQPDGWFRVASVEGGKPSKTVAWRGGKGPKSVEYGNKDYAILEEPRKPYAGGRKESWQVGGQHPHTARRRKSLPQTVKDAMKWQKNKDAGVVPRKTLGDVVIGAARGAHQEKGKFEPPKKGGVPSKVEQDFDKIREFQNK